MRTITMFAGDREYIRHSARLVRFIINELDSISDCVDVKEVTETLERAEKQLNKIDVQTVTHQISPGTQIP